VARADAGRHRDRRMGDGDVLEIDRADPFAARLDHVLAAVGDLHEAVGVDRADVAGRKPAVDERIAAFALEVVRDDPRAAHHQLARGLAVARQLLAVVADDLHVDAEHGAALLGLHRHALFGAQSFVLGLERAGRAERAHLGHSPGVQHLHAVAFLEGLHHRGRACRAADDGAAHGAELQVVRLDVGEQALPDRRHAGRDRDVLAFEQVVQRLAVEPRTRKDELGADHAGDVRQSPGVDVEHRHHRQHRVARRALQGVGKGRRVGVQHRRAVAVQGALRIAGRSRRVAERRRGVLVELGPLERVARAVDQILVAEQVRHVAGGTRDGHVGTVRHRDERLDRLHARGDRLDQRQEGQVEEKDLVLGMVGDPDDLVRVQARVERVQHGARTRHRVVQLHVAVAVPRQRRDAVAELDALRGERVGHPARTAGELAIGRAVEVTLDAARDHFALAVVALGVDQQRRDQQRLLHHQSVHDVLPFRCGGSVADQASAGVAAAGARASSPARALSPS
jgi:hypothetical protein